jgi:CheY-like chemotaxis protein
MAKKILVVEDEPDILRVIEFIFKKKGYHVFSATDGEQALDLAKRYSPDLVILDFFLPVMSGKDVSGSLKADERLKDIPVLLLTASADDIENKAKECQVDDFLLKPFEHGELIEKAEKLLTKTL